MHINDINEIFTNSGFVGLLPHFLAGLTFSSDFRIGISPYYQNGFFEKSCRNLVPRKNNKKLVAANSSFHQPVESRFWMKK